MKMEPIERSETSASNTQTPGNYPKETVLHLQHGENPNLKLVISVSSCGLTEKIG
jgi:hypothetical protein